MSARAMNPSARLVGAFLAVLVSAGCPVVFDGAGTAEGGAGAQVLVRTTVEPPGDACPHGGKRVEHGLDADGDGALSDDEVSAPPSFLCDGPPADRALEVRVEKEPASEEQCPAGGVLVRAGVDRDGDGSLSGDEVTELALICDGVDGLDGEQGAAGLVRSSVVLPGAECAEGGQRIELGLDDNGDGILQPNEVALTRILCHGAAGPAGDEGEDGVLTLIRVTGVGPSADCPDGGQEVALGADTNGDGVLSESEVEAVALVCDAEAGNVVLGAGRNEGTALAPVPVPLNAPLPRLSTVAALGQSHYLIENGPHAAAYRFSFTGLDSSLDVGLFAHPQGTAVALDCAQEGPDASCTSDELAAGQAYRLRVSEQEEVANAFGLTIGIGGALGDDDAPVPLTDGAGAMVRPSGYVGPGERSVFSFSVPTSDAYTLALEDLTLSTEDPIRWTLTSEERPIRTRCLDAHAPCVAGYLEAGVSYTLIVEAPRRGAAFSVAFHQGDTLTPELPLDETLLLEDLALPEVRVFQVRTGAAIEHTLRTYGVGQSVLMSFFNGPPFDEWDDPWGIIDQEPADGSLSWLEPVWLSYPLELEPDRIYYVAILNGVATASPIEVRLSSRGGDETGVPLTVDGPAHPGSTRFESSYHFLTGAVASRYSVELISDVPVLYAALELALFDADTDEVLGTFHDWSSDEELRSLMAVTEELPPNRAVRLEVSSGGPLTYSLAVKSGDVVTSPLEIDVPVSVALDAHAWSVHVVDVLAPTSARLSMSGGYGSVRVTFGWPGVGGPWSPEAETLAACAGSACEEDLVLPPGRIYLALQNELPEATTFQVTFASSGAHLIHGTPRTVPIAGRGVVRMWVENDLEAAHRLSIVNPAQLRLRPRLRRADDFTVEWQHHAGLMQSIISLPVLGAGSPLPVGDWILEIENESYGEGAMTLNLTRP